MKQTSCFIACAIAFVSLTGCGGGGGHKASGPTYALSVTVTGMSGSGLILSNGGDSLPVSANGSSTFPTRLPVGATYSVAVATQPLTPSQTCVVANATGTVASADVSGIAVTCTTNAFAIGGTVTGLSGTLVLQNNGGDDLSLNVNGPFTFTTGVKSGAPYSVVVATQPNSPPQRCLVDSGAGAVGNGTVTSVTVECETQYPRLAYALNAGDGTVSVYGVDSSTGALRARGAAKVGARPVDAVTSASGGTSYVFNAGSATVSAFARNTLTGDLTEIAGSPFATGATAGGTSGALTMHPGNGFLYVANADGANTVSAFKVENTGALSAVTGSPFSAGTMPTSVTVHPSGRFAYVLNATSKDVYVYSINTTTGVLFELSASRAATGAGSASFNLHPNGRFAYVANAGDSSLSVYSVDWTTGSLTAVGAAVPLGFAPQGKVQFHASGRYLYINGTSSGNSSLAGYAIAADTGALTALAGSPYNTGGVSAVAFGMDPAGKLLYAATRSNATVGSIAMFRIGAATGALSTVGSLPLGPPSFGPPTTIQVDPSGKFVYAANSALNVVYSFGIDSVTGGLNPLGPFASVMRTGDQPVAFVVDSAHGRPTPSAVTSRFAYVANLAGNSLSAYTLNSQTGVLSPTGSALPVGNGPRALASTVGGFELFATTQFDSTIAAFDIDATSGALSLVHPGLSADPALVAVATTPNGRFVFVANTQGNSVTGYRFDKANSLLTATGSVADAGASPVALAVDPTGRVLFFVTGTTVGHAAIDAKTGALTAGTPYSIAGATAIAVDPTGRFAYVTIGSTPGSVQAFAINPFAEPLLGTLTPVASAAATGAVPLAVVVDPTARYVFTADSAANSISAFRMDQTTGALSAIGSYAAGTNPLALSVDYAGKFLYAANSDSHTVSVFAIAANGTLTPVVDVPTGSSPVAIAIAGEVH